MALAIAAIAMLFVGIRPFRVREWIWAVGGAAIAVLVGVEPVADAARAVLDQWNVLLFILGLMGLSTAAESSGLFAWLADVLVERARGSRRRLFVAIYLAGAAVTALLSNDATALVFTPMVFRAVARREGDPLPYLFACTFVADTASFGLPFANPANVLVLPRPHLGAYLLHLGPPQIAALAINLLLFLWLFAPRLRGTYEFTPAGPIPRRAVRALTAVVCVGAAYVAALLAGWPLGPVAAVGALAALAVAAVPAREAVRHVGWSTFALLAALFALLDGVARGGFVQVALAALDTVARAGALAAILAASAGAALLANVLNNLPVAVASSYVVAHAPTPAIAYPLIAGVDIGPNLTTAGSLATILWLSVLRQRGVRVSTREYLRLGAVVVPPMILVTALWLWVVR
ncbi:MAG TPA: SLC13 family permease [Candidatus Dormibacteraeota bacterium]|nr:SLC13 family permease [Candidatus Dormibacteraeota bacterium]